MARMIDADVLTEEISTLGVTVTGLYAPKGVLREYAQHYRESVLQVIDDMPTLWISVKDRLPKTGTVLATDGQVVITAPASSVTADGPAITHWMPLPSVEGLNNKPDYSEEK